MTEVFLSPQALAIYGGLAAFAAGHVNAKRQIIVRLLNAVARVLAPGSVPPPQPPAK